MPGKPVQPEECKLQIDWYSIPTPPKVVFNDRIIILMNNEGKLMFYDVNRHKFIAQCNIQGIYIYCIAGDDLIYRSYSNYLDWKKIALPFMPQSREGDFLFYTAIDSVLPSPFLSVSCLRFRLSKLIRIGITC